MRLVNLAEYEIRARERVEGSTLDYYDGGANDEITLRENVAAFSRITLYPRVFRGVGRRDASTTILGVPTSTPVIVAPLGLLGMLHPDGEVPVVRAASAAGSIVTMSTVSVTPIEDAVAAATGPVWFQLYVYKDRSASEALVRRVEAAGCTALQLTADAPRMGRRERDIRNNLSLPENLWAPNLTADGTLPSASSAGAKSPLAPTEPSLGISGSSPRFSAATSRSIGSSRMPEYPRASAFALATIIARVSIAENSGPCPTVR